MSYLATTIGSEGHNHVATDRPGDHDALPITTTSPGCRPASGLGRVGLCRKSQAVATAILQAAFDQALRGNPDEIDILEQDWFAQTLAETDGRAALRLFCEVGRAVAHEKQGRLATSHGVPIFPVGLAAFRTASRKREAGVDILAGTDAAAVGIAGTAHGVSMHGELSLLVRAGLSPLEALRAATSVTARRFGLSDRGRIAPGLQADLLLVEGDPTTNIGDTLSIRGIWRRGEQLDREMKRRRLG